MTKEFVTLPREVVEQVLKAAEAFHSHYKRNIFSGCVPSEELYFSAARALLRAALEQPKNHIEQHLGMVPAGWKLVPVEPTKDMLDAYVRLQARFNSARSDWAAMLAAAPLPPAAQRGTAASNARSIQVIDALTSYCKTGEIDGADDLLAELLFERDHPTALEQPKVELEPVAWYDGNKFYGSKAAASMNMANMTVLSPVYLHPQPKREPLTDEAKAAIDAARAAMDESTESYSGRGDISIPSELAAALSLRLDEYDRTIEAAHGIK